jgi:hypothetical protein
MISTLNVLLFWLKVLEFLCVMAILIIGVDLAWYTFDGWHQKTTRVKAEEAAKSKVQELKKRAQARLRNQKEAEAWDGFFKDGYVFGFDINGEFLYRGEHRFPTEKAEEYSREMDKRAADQIFENTEDF